MKACFFCVLFGWLALTASMRLAAAEPTPFNGTPFQVPGRIEAEEFDLGGEGVAYHGLGAVVTNITPQSGVLVTNLYEPVPRDRAGANIGVVVQPDKSLLLRQSEWVTYTCSVTEPGYFSIQLKTTGPMFYWGYAGDCAAPLLFSGGESRFSIQIDDGQSEFLLTNASTNVISRQVWLSAGTHRLRLAAVVVPDALTSAIQAYPGALHNQWRYFTLAVDWLQIVPAAVPLRAFRIAGGALGFADSQGKAAQLASPKIVGEDDTGSLIVIDERNHAVRRVERDGVVATLPGSPQTPGHVTLPPGAAPVRFVQAQSLPGDGLLLLLTQEPTNSMIVKVSTSSEVATLFSGSVVVPGVRQLVGETDGLTNLPATLDRIELTPEGEIEALVGVDETWVTSCHGWFAEARGFAVARFRLGVSGVLDLVSKGSVQWPSLDQGDLGDEYRFDGGKITQATAPSFPQTVLDNGGMISAYRAKDGSLWGSDYSTIYRLMPESAGSFLLIEPSPDGRVDGSPLWLVGPDEDVTLSAVPLRQFRAFLRWSDGNTDNPRTLRLTSDTTLSASFELNLPSGHGIDSKSLSLESDGYLQFVVLGPDNGNESFNYLLESTTDLKTWVPVQFARILDEGGVFSDGYVYARKAATVIRFIPSTPSCYVRATLLY